MWIGLILLVIVIVIVWWLLTRNVRLSEEEAPKHSDTHEESTVHAVVDKPVAAPEVEVLSRAATISAEAEVPSAPAVGVVADDLTVIEGIGPKIDSVLKAAGIHTFKQLCDAKPEDLKKILTDAGIRLGDPTTWPQQACLAASGNWDGLMKLQTSLVAGREVHEDDLEIVEGIGPKINSILKAAGIKTFTQLAAANPDDIKKLLTDAGLQLGDPTSWPEQARLAAAGDTEGLQKYQDSLKGGRIVT